MKGSEISAVSANRPARTPAPRVRLAALVAFLLLLAALVPISRRYLQSAPPPPPASAGTRAAMSYYAKRIEHDPSDVQAYVELGRRDEAAEYYTDALKHLYAARALGAKDQEIVLPLGRALTHLARFDEAGEELSKAVRLMPDSLEAFANLAGLYDAYGKPDLAARTLRDYVARHPALTAGGSLSAVSASQTNPFGRNAPVPGAAGSAAANTTRDVERLMFCFLDAGDDEMAITMAENLIRLAPDLPDGYSIAGKTLLTRHEPKAALEKLAKAVQIAPNESALLYQYGLALAQNGREEDALQQWQKTAALTPQATDAYYRLAEVYARRKDYKRAAPILQRIAMRENTNLIMVHATAAAYDKLGDKPAAAYWHSMEAHLQRNGPAALAYGRQAAADPRWRNRGMARVAEAYRDMNRVSEYLDTIRQMTAGHTAEEDVALANAYGFADKLTEQVSLLKGALLKHPKDPADIFFQLSQVAERKGLRDEAEAELEQCGALNPNNPTYALALGNQYFERRSQGDRLQRAVREYARYSRLMPNDAAGYVKLGIANAAAGDLRHAAQNLEHALDLQPGEGSTYQELGRVYARLGDTSSSERMFQLYKKFISYDLKRQTLLTKSRAARKDPAAQIALAEFLEQAGDYPSASKFYDLAYALRPGDAALKIKTQRIHTMLGQTTN